MYNGQCLCASVRFRIEGELQPIQVCHCSQCRRAQGGPFATNIPVDEASFALLAGSDVLSEYESSPGKYRVFCRTCGSPVFSKKNALPGVLRVRAGLISEPLETRAIGHFFFGSKANWWPIEDGLPRFDGPYKPKSASPSER
ncbi:Uncharacterized conserved protein [Halopseudomonas xinjiangensis]|uniref:Uncharacterized conserved protein n=1 Tax=Halopseudomonas xinjiangensis TaxID=487184 RepID=A0A1H1RFD2_9GAMM|nr:GFA family protein [Halopseudomonas xinjiangensis]SDS33639.1 Uncharacterized conserved protein [Halopseudomonas xinjiangensis]